MKTAAAALSSCRESRRSWFCSCSFQYPPCYHSPCGDTIQRTYYNIFYRKMQVQNCNLVFCCCLVLSCSHQTVGKCKTAAPRRMLRSVLQLLFQVIFRQIFCDIEHQFLRIINIYPAVMRDIRLYSALIGNLRPVVSDSKAADQHRIRNINGVVTIDIAPF